MFRLKVSLIALALAGLAAAAPDALAQSKPTIGIAMPTKSSARWTSFALYFAPPSILDPATTSPIRTAFRA